MKNIKIALSVILLILNESVFTFAQPGITSDLNVTWLHGLNGRGQLNGWSELLTAERRMRGGVGNVSSQGGIEAIASNTFNQQRTSFSANSVTIGHSLGGVVARHLDLGGTPMGGIITIGSPLDGAPIANSILNGGVNFAVSNGINQLERGPWASLLPFPTMYALVDNINTNVTSPFLATVFNAIANTNTWGGSTTLNDIKEGGYQSDINANPTNTPKISIWGNETQEGHWEIAKSATGTDVPFISDVMVTVYDVFTATFAGIGAFNWWNPGGWYAFYVSTEWWAGSTWIRYDSERHWNNLIGSDMVVQRCVDLTYTYCTFPDSRCAYTPQNWQYCMTRCNDYTRNVCLNIHNNGLSDAFIPAVSQRGDGSRSWRVGSQPIRDIEAMQTNHWEELQPQSAEMLAIFDRIFLATPGSGIEPVFRIDRR
jgi:hypothetical protein